MSNQLDAFKVMIIVMTFYSLSVTLIAHTIPQEALTYVGDYEELSNKFQNQDLSGRLQGTLSDQTSLPAIELGALLFYSGNILIDIILNFVFAIPGMMGLVINGIQTLFNIDGYLFLQVQLTLSGLMLALYMVGVIQMIMNMRSSRGVGLG